MGYTKDFNNIELTTINVPGSVGTYDVNTLDDALKYIQNKYIRPGTTVTINIAPGIYNFTSPIIFNYEFGYNLNIVGDTTTKTISSYTGISGGSGAWYVTYTFSDVANLSVGMYISFDSLTGINICPHYGTWKITAINGSSVTILNTFYKNFPNLNQSSITYGAVIIYNTIFNFNNCDGLVITKCITLSLFDQIILIGNIGYNGITSKSNSYINCGEISVVGFTNGVMCSDEGIFESTSLNVCSNVNGIVCRYKSDMNIPWSVINGNSNYGIYNLGYSRISALNISSIGNNITDVLTQDKSITYIDYYCCTKSGCAGSISSVFSPSLGTNGNNLSMNIGQGVCIYLASTGNYNVGNNNTGTSNVGNNNTGDHNQGNNNAGKYCSGNNLPITCDHTNDVLNLGINQGTGNIGIGNVGNNNQGNYNIGRNNIGDHNVGNNNVGNYNIGDNNNGDHNTGHDNWGNNNYGKNNHGNNNKGKDIQGNNIDNVGSGNIGQHNVGIGNVGNNNTGNWNVGNNNNGNYNIGNNNGNSVSGTC